jgi:hypothetical protein
LRQVAWKRSTPELPDDAKAAGSWRGIPCDFVLPIEHADQTLWSPIRPTVIAYFDEKGIAWHDGETTDYGPRAHAGPSPHLLDSQVCALNFWWGLSRSSDALTALLRTIFPEAREAVSPTSDRQLLDVEWIGTRNYLGERGQRRRGQYATSADLLVAFVDDNNLRHGVLIESKYTESYEHAVPNRVSRKGTDRAAIYLPAYERARDRFRRDGSVSLAELLIEPFDQHLRQQLLAFEMERAAELDFRTVRCLHVAPAANESFHRTIPIVGLASFESVGAAWSSLLVDPAAYRSAYYEDLFASIRDPSLADWRDYQRARYGWGEP